MPTIQIKLNEKEAERVKAVKARAGMTWPSFLKYASDAYDFNMRCKDDGR